MKFKSILEKYGVNQIELAKRLDINRVSISRLLSEKNDLRLSTLAKIADAIGCSITELIESENVSDESEKHTFIICPHCGERIKLSVEK